MNEKRILIQEYDENPCLSCTNDCKKYPCEAKREWVLGACIKGPDKNYKRSEVIEKISHALCTKVHGACEICEAVAGGNENHCNDYRTYAEAVLNALLGVNNASKN